MISGFHGPLPGRDYVFSIENGSELLNHVQNTSFDSWLFIGLMSTRQTFAT